MTRLLADLGAKHRLELRRDLAPGLTGSRRSRPIEPDRARAELLALRPILRRNPSSMAHATRRRMVRDRSRRDTD